MKVANYPTFREKGVTLVSLLVASLIGIFLVATVIKVYLDSKESFQMRDLVAEVSENERFAIEEMRRVLIMAGRDILAMEDEQPTRRPFPPVETSPDAGTGIVDGGTSGSDVIAVRYRKGPSCGQYLDIDIACRPAEVRFMVQDGDLVCAQTTYIDTSETGSNNCSSTPTTTTRTLISGVHRLKALYGVDDDADGFANRYLTASQIEDDTLVTPPQGGASPWSRVVSIRFALLLGSERELPARYRQENEQNLEMFGLPIEAPDDAHLYRVITSTLAFRNLNPIIQRQ